MLYKYMQLARDILALLSHTKCSTFTHSGIRDEINVSRGFYSYSNTTLRNAIRYLMHIGYISLLPIRVTFHYTYLFHNNATILQRDFMAAYNE